MQDKRSLSRKRWAVLVNAVKNSTKNTVFHNSEESTIFVSNLKLLKQEQLKIEDSYEADYWVSQNKKYCEFCKCWITDNRPSLDFHEKGRRHQESVKRKLRNITKHSTQAQRNLTRTDATIQQMESAALQAYKKDMELNGDMSSALVRKQLQSGSSIKKIWREVKSRDGKSSYVNFFTKETVWQRPKEGFMTVAEQKEAAEKEAQKQYQAVEAFKRKEGMINLQKIQAEEAEESARKAREKMKERRVAEEPVAETYGPLLEPGRTDPYGRWQTVKETEVVDWELPATEEPYQEPCIEYVPEPIVKEFQEKTVESLGEGETSFKKRKINNSANRNTRRRLDDD